MTLKLIWHNHCFEGKKYIFDWNSVVWLTQVFYHYFISVPGKIWEKLLWFRTRTNFWMLESLWEWKLQAQDSFNHSFPLKASASAIAVEVVETMWRFKTESFSSCYTDSTPMAIPEFSNLLFQGSFNFLCRVTPQSTIFTGSKHLWWVSSLSTF